MADDLHRPKVLRVSKAEGVRGGECRFDLAPVMLGRPFLGARSDAWYSPVAIDPAMDE